MKPYEQRLAEAQGYREECLKKFRENPTQDPSQKFSPGDRVSVVRLPREMNHFRTGVATVKYSYAQVYGGSSDDAHNSYCLDFDDSGETSWYPAGTMEALP